MGGVGGEQNRCPCSMDGVGPAVMDVGGGQQTQAGMVVPEVVGEEGNR